MAKRNSVSAIEREIGDLKARREVLASKLSEAEVKVEREIADQRARLVSGTIDDETISGGGGAIAAAFHARDVLADSVQVLDAKITEGEARLVSERDRARRPEAAGELGTFSDKLSAAVDALAATVAPLAAAVDPVTSRTPHLNAQFGAGIRGLLDQIVSELRNVVATARAHAAALIAGETTTIRTATSTEVLATVPQIERLSVMPIADVKWIENGETSWTPSR
jgi:hypothetical protein